MKEEILEEGEVKLAMEKCGPIVSKEMLDYFKEKYGDDVELRVEFIRAEGGPKLRFRVVKLAERTS
ncbi:MAG: hypothetical protein DRJ98_07290 [Thermoprotei archaeon]|nr:MAG: hypothetical protein DRJ98_07290 [Thermoprotei archaeon]RLF18745.1 MAG: hypothetical protein DRN06_00475 [Thermoprotei archaeon]